MRHAVRIFVISFLAATLPVAKPAFAFAAEANAPAKTTDATVISCGSGIPGGISCIPSHKDFKQARAAYKDGLKLQEHRRLQEAYVEFDEASRLEPQNTAFFSAREIVKSQLVFQHTERGDAFLAAFQPEQAAAEYRAALNLDPDNDYTQQRLAEALRRPDAGGSGALPLLLIDSNEIRLQPKTERATFHYRGDVRGLFTELASAYGVNAEFDDSVQSKTVRFYVDDLDFFTALHLAGRVSKTMWTALDSHQFLVASDTPENHKQLDRMSLGTFALPGGSTPQDATQMITSLRNICEFQKVNSGQNGIIEVRAPQPLLAACSILMRQLNNDRPQVSIDVEIYENMYNIPVAALVGLGGQSISSLVNQLISSGGINAAGSSALSGLLAQLQGQGNSIFSQPLATFGNGLSFSGVSLDHLTAALSLNESWARSLSRATLRANDGNEATFHVGERYPILNASYAPIYNSPAISAVVGNQSYVPPFPSVSYEDLGLSLKVKPSIGGEGDVTMTLEMQVRSLTGQSSNGVPVISNEEYHGGIRLRDGEPAVVAGEITTNDSLAMSGIPALSQIPGLNFALADNTRMKEEDELLIVLTPHVVANHAHDAHEIWVSEK
jgi:general secretion pathway protein D